MQSPDDPELRAEIRQRMSPPNRESVAEIARSTGVNAQTLYSWRHRWKQEGLLVPATSKAPEEWSAADKLPAVNKAAGLSGEDLGAYCRERGLFPKQLARWRQVAEDANNHKAPSMSE
ncbi:MAG: transposase [Cyanobacteriota bacterium]